jgi:hypothetical protein
MDCCVQSYLCYTIYSALIITFPQKTGNLNFKKILTHLLRWWIAVADFIIYAGSIDDPYISANVRATL